MNWWIISSARICVVMTSALRRRFTIVSDRCISVIAILFLGFSVTLRTIIFYYYIHVIAYSLTCHVIVNTGETGNVVMDSNGDRLNSFVLYTFGPGYDQVPGYWTGVRPLLHLYGSRYFQAGRSGINRLSLTIRVYLQPKASARRISLAMSWMPVLQRDSSWPPVPWAGISRRSHYPH